MVAGDRISTIIIFYLPLYALFCFSMEKGIGMNKKFLVEETKVLCVENKSFLGRKQVITRLINSLKIAYK